MVGWDLLQHQRHNMMTPIIPKTRPRMVHRMIIPEPSFPLPDPEEDEEPSRPELEEDFWEEEEPLFELWDFVYWVPESSLSFDSLACLDPEPEESCFLFPEDLVCSRLPASSYCDASDDFLMCFLCFLCLLCLLDVLADSPDSDPLPLAAPAPAAPAAPAPPSDPSNPCGSSSTPP